MRPRARSDVCSHRSSPRSSLHTPLDISTSPPAVYLVYPPHTTSPGRVRSQSFALCREALHTPVSRHAPTSPLCSATRAQNSGRATTREVAHLATARVVGAMLRHGGACVCVCTCFAKQQQRRRRDEDFFSSPKATTLSVTSSDLMDLTILLSPLRESSWSFLSWLVIGVVVFFVRVSLSATTRRAAAAAHPRSTALTQTLPPPCIHGTTPRSRGDTYRSPSSSSTSPKQKRKHKRKTPRDIPPPPTPPPS
jgi:hypothetical protein